MTPRKKKPVVELSSKLPSPAAMSIAASVGLLQFDPGLPIVDDQLNNPDDYDPDVQTAWLERLRQFQQMCLAGAELKACQVVYTGFNLSKKHKDALKVIHTHTEAFVRGALMDELVTNLEYDHVGVATVVDKMLKEETEDNPEGAGVHVHMHFDKDDEKL